MEPDLKILPFLGNTKRVLVVGDVVLDRYMYGTCSRLAEERPVPIFRESTTEYRLGGASNVVNNLDALGFSVDLLTVLGRVDTPVTDMLKQRNFSTEGLVFLSDYEVLTITRYMSNNKLVLRSDKRKHVDVCAEMEEKIIKKYKMLMSEKQYDAVVFADYRSDYKCSMLSCNVMSVCISVASERSIPTLVDPKKGDYNKFYGTNFIKPNRSDASSFLQRSINNDEDVEDACKEFCSRLNAQTCFMTLSERGMAVYKAGSGQQTSLFRVIPINKNTSVMNVNGAGDTVSAALTFGIVHGWNLADACVFANRCAANVVQRSGTDPVRVIDVLSDMVITTREELTNLKRIIPKDSTVVLTPGCFDIAHLGHIECLRQSKELGDYLIVAVNSDVSARTKEGANMPICSVSERVGLLEAIEYIDFIVIFDELYPQWVVEILEPDVFVEGEDTEEKLLRETYPSIRKIHFIRMENEIRKSDIISKIKDAQN